MVEPASVRSVISAVSCCSNNELTESKYSGVLPPEEFMLRCSAGGRIKARGDVSVHNRGSICALAHLKSISTSHPLSIRRPMATQEPNSGVWCPQMLSVSSTRTIILCLMIDTKSNNKSLITDSGVNNTVYGTSYSSGYS